MFTPPPPQPYNWQAQPLCYVIWQSDTMINLNSLCGEVKLSCSNFRSKEEAQAAFDKKQLGTQGLDGDGDGKVCEWGTLGSVLDLWLRLLKRSTCKPFRQRVTNLKHHPKKIHFGEAKRLLKIFDSVQENTIIASQPLIDPLSDRELEVLQYLATGMSNQAIADQLFVSLAAVKWHARNIYGKLEVNNRTQAVARARELGFLG